MQTEELQIKIGQEIKKLRLDKEWTQEQTAGQLHLTRNAYSDIETGKTDICISRLTQIANFFGVDVTFLLDTSANRSVTNNHLHNDHATKSHIENPQISQHTHCHFYGATEKLQYELEKQQLTVELKDKELALQQREIIYLKKMLEMSEKLNGENNATH